MLRYVMGIMPDCHHSHDMCWNVEGGSWNKFPLLPHPCLCVLIDKVILSPMLEGFHGSKSIVRVSALSDC